MTVVTDYTLNASAKTITLGTDFLSTTLEQIFSITDLTKKIDIYDYRDPRKRRGFRKENGSDISILNGVITYIEDAGIQNGDEIQIIIDDIITVNASVTVDTTTPLNVNVNNTAIPIDSSTPVNVNVSNTSLSVNDSTPLKVDVSNTGSVGVNINNTADINVNVTNPNLLGLSDVLTVFTTKSVTPSTTEHSTAQDMRNVSYAEIFIKNSGSTNCTINVYGSPDSTGNIKPLIGTTTLNATTVTQDDISIAKCPNYLFIDAVNSDTLNPAIVDIAIQKTVLSNVLRPYADVLTVYSSESVAVSTTINSTAQDIRGASFVYPYIKNSGSTDLTVNVYGSYNISGTIKTLIRKYVLDTTVTQAGNPIDKCPNYLFFETINGDDTHIATVDISVQRG